MQSIFHPDVLFGLDPMWTSTILLVVVYVVIITERVNRAIIALLGAGLMIQFGVLDQTEAVKGIDFNTIALLTGMMLLVSVSRKSGMFQFVAIWSAKRAKAVPWRVMLMLSVTTAVLSAFLDNVTTVLLIVPVTLAVTKALDVPPFPFLFSEVLASNIGGTATLIGDPPNILIGTQAKLSFDEFVIHLAPAIVLVLVVQAVMTHLVWGQKLRATAEAEARVMAMNERDAIEDWRLLKQSLVILALVMAAFVLARPLQLEPGTVAMFGAAVLMLLDTHEHHPAHQSARVTQTFNEVEWITIFFFIGLFIVVHGVEVGGLLQRLAELLVKATGGNKEITAYAILWASAFLSAIVDNIPFVATMIPLIKSTAPAYGGLENIEPLWWALSLGACLGGNGTLIGASANLTVAGLADREGIPFRFWTYTFYAFPMMLVSIAICQIYVWLRYFYF